MRSKFPGYYKLSESEVKRIFRGALIVLDANVLLNLYRYSKETAESPLGLLEKWRDRIWLPHQVALEYHRNRLGEISRQRNAYAEAAGNLKGVVEPFEEERRHPYIGKDKLEELKQVVTKITEELDASKESLRALLDEDWVLDRVTPLLEGKVGDAFTEEEADRARGEGAKRRADKRPPGFRDKDEGKPDEQRFGDYVLWTQILERAASDKTHVLFVTDDVKEDWWHIHDGKRLGPRPELVQEFLEKTGKRVLMWTTGHLLAVGKDEGQDVGEEAIEEARRLQRMRLAREMNRRVRAMGLRRSLRSATTNLAECEMEMHAREGAMVAARASFERAGNRLHDAGLARGDPGGEELYEQVVRERRQTERVLDEEVSRFARMGARRDEARRQVAEIRDELLAVERRIEGLDADRSD